MKTETKLLCGWLATLALSLWYFSSSDAAQHHLNYGAAANDGTGDSLRTAFSKVESNFNALYSTVGLDPSSIDANAIARGSNSLALGRGAIATTNLATALGLYSGATAPNALALGAFSTATNISSLAVGDVDTFAGGLYSVALGGGAVALHDYSAAIGPQSTTTASNQIRLGTATSIVSIPGGLQAGYGPAFSLATNAIFVIDLAAGTNNFISTTANGGYNFSLRFTNVAAGRWCNVSILGPPGSNQVSYIWPPDVITRWPCNSFTDLPETNSYVRTNCYLELAVQCYATNNVRAAGRLFK